MAQSILSFYLIGLLFSAGERRVFWTKHASFKNHLYKKKKRKWGRPTHHTHTVNTHTAETEFGKTNYRLVVSSSVLCLVYAWAHARTRACVYVHGCMCDLCACVCASARARSAGEFFSFQYTPLLSPSPHQAGPNWSWDWTPPITRRPKSMNLSAAAIPWIDLLIFFVRPAKWLIILTLDCSL